jgi:hypothetical protein
MITTRTVMVRVTIRPRVKTDGSIACTYSATVNGSSVETDGQSLTVNPKDELSISIPIHMTLSDGFEMTIEGDE